MSRSAGSINNVVAAEAPSATEAAGDDAEHLGRTGSEWSNFLLEAIFAIYLLVIASVAWFDCGVIPSLNVNVALVGVFNLLIAATAFGWRVERLGEHGEHLTHPALAVHFVLNVVVVGIAIWGAVLTFGNVPMMGMEGEGQCNSVLFISAFVSSIITLAFGLYFCIGVLREERRRE